MVKRNFIQEELKSFLKDGIFSGEVYIKMIEGNGNEYYWYFNLISTDGDSISLIISNMTGEILASNINVKNG